MRVALASEGNALASRVRGDAGSAATILCVLRYLSVVGVRVALE